MARIETYPIDAVLSDSDLVLGSNADDSNKTVNFTVGDLKTYIQSSTAYTAGSGLALNGTVFSNTAQNQVVAITGGSGINISGAYPNFTVSNAAPDQNVVLTAGVNTTITGTYPSFTISSSGGASTSIEESFIGLTGAPINFVGIGTLTTLLFTTANNATDTTSYHVGTAPAGLQNTAGVIENISATEIIVNVDFSCSVSFVGGNGEVVYYLQKSVDNGVTWTNKNVVTRSHSGGASVAQHSFYFVELMNSGDRLRTRMEGTTGATLEPYSIVSFTVKALGNII